MNTWKRTAAALAGAALLGMNALPALAAEIDEPAASPEEQQIAPYVMGGQATIKELPGQQNENQMLVTIQNPGEDPWDLALNIGEQTIFLDNAAGTPVSADTLKEGQSVYVYYSLAMTRSLPPQSAAYAVLTNVGEASPAKLHVAEQVLAGPDGQVTVMTDHGSLLVTATEETQMANLMDKSVVKAQDLKMGTWFFAWYDVVALSYPGQTAAQRMVLLPMEEQQPMDIQVNGKAIEAKTQMKDGVLMVPMRPVAEALGFQISWDQETRKTTISSEKGRIVLTIDQDEYLYTAAEGDQTAQPKTLGAAPEIQQPGTTWAPAQVFALLAQRDVVSFVDGALHITVAEQ